MTSVPWSTTEAYTQAPTLTGQQRAASVCWASARRDACRLPVLTTMVEQRQRQGGFRQREGLKERSAVADTVERSIYGAQKAHTLTTEAALRQSRPSWELLSAGFMQLSRTRGLQPDAFFRPLWLSGFELKF